MKDSEKTPVEPSTTQATINTGEANTEEAKVEEQSDLPDVELGIPSGAAVPTQENFEIESIEEMEEVPNMDQYLSSDSSSASTSTASADTPEKTLPNIHWQGLKAAFRFIGDEALLRKIIEAKYPDNPEKVEEELAATLERSPETERVAHDDINGARAFNIDLEIPDNINEVQLLEYFKGVLEKYARFSTEGTNAEHQTTPKSWFESDSNRARLVLIETTDDNIKDIAKAIIEASPLERVVAVGLNEDQQLNLEIYLTEFWQEKIAKIEATETLIEGQERYGTRLLETLKEINQKPEATSLADFDLDELTGPHSYTETKDISFGALQNALDTTFASKIDEIILYGTDDAMAQELPILSKRAESGQYIAIRSEEFNTEDVSKFWAVSLKGVENPISHITSSKSPDAMLAEGKHEVNPALEAFFKTKGEEHGLAKEQSNFLKDMFVSNSMYIPYLSPKLYPITITKTQSGINGKGATAVGIALPYGAIGLIIASAKGSRFAVNATMVDTANDMNFEKQAKSETYKSLFLNLLEHFEKDPNNTLEQANEKAMDHLFIAYKEIESHKDIKFNEKEGQSIRNDALKHANRTNITNERGIVLLQPQPLIFAYGLVQIALGLKTLNDQRTNTNQDQENPLPLGANLSVTGFAFSTLLTSLLLQKSANAYHLVRWHRMSATSTGYNKKAQDIRQKSADGIFAAVKKTNGLDKFMPSIKSQAIPVKKPKETTVKKRKNNESRRVNI